MGAADLHAVSATAEGISLNSLIGDGIVVLSVRHRQTVLCLWNCPLARIWTNENSEVSLLDQVVSGEQAANVERG